MIIEIQAKTLLARVKGLDDWFGLTYNMNLYRERAYYYDKLGQLFPGLRRRYEKAFGERYSAPARNARQLGQVLDELCEKLGIGMKMPVFTPQKRVRVKGNQLALF